MYAKVAFLGLVNRKGRTLLTMLAIAIAISMAILLVSVGVGLKQGAAAMYDSDADIWIIPEGSSVTDFVTSSENTMLGDVHQSFEKIISYPGITGATPVLNRLLYASSGEGPKVILGMGLIPGSVDSLPASGLTPGDPFYYSAGDLTGEVLINEKTARLLDLEPGDTLYLGASASNLNNSFRVVSVISAVEYSISPVVVLHLSELQELTGNLEGDRANHIIARGEGSYSLDPLKKLFPGAVVMSSVEYQAYSVVSDRKILATAIAVSAVSVLIAVLFISSTMILSMNEKQREFAVMSAIGISRRSIIMIVLYEVVILSLLGGITGIVLSSLGSELLNMASLHYFEVGQVAVVNPVMQLSCVGLALAAGIVSGLIPVFMTGRIDIVETLG